MKILLIIAIGLLLGAGLIWLADFEPGFVLLQYGQWSLETSLVVFVIAFVLLLSLGYLSLRTVASVKAMPSRLSQWQDETKTKRAAAMLTRGLIALEEGKWSEAERVLVRYAGNSGTPLLHYLAAAKAAQKQDAYERRDEYLSLAHQSERGADIAVGLAQAELQLAAGQKEQALATLQHLKELTPKHPYVLQLLQQTYADMEQWQDVQLVLPDLRKRHVLPNVEVDHLSVEAVVGEMSAALLRQDWDATNTIWQQVATKQRHQAPLLTVYVESLIQQREVATAAELIERFLNKEWNTQLAYLYGTLQRGENLDLLLRAEKWLKLHGESATLLLTLGRLAKANKLWVKAEEYLSASIKLEKRGETYKVLAEVFTVQDKQDDALRAYRDGLTLMVAEQ
jgi:HemY protein